MRNIFVLYFFILPSISINSQGNVGIGITSPVAKLHIKGTADGSQLMIDAHSAQSNTNPLIRLNNSNGSALMWIHSDSPLNTFVGVNTGRVNAASEGGLFNTFIGAEAGYSNTTGDGNTATGIKALYFNSEGFGNTAIGAQALYSNTSGINNTAMGTNALVSNTTGWHNTAIGLFALAENKAGSQATAIGMNAMQYANNTTTPFINLNVAVGYAALQGHVNNIDNTGNRNTAIGSEALTDNRTGNDNTAVGKGALENNTSGESNTANGFEALSTNMIGSTNTANGYRALFSNISGINNTAIGVNALFENETGHQNTAIGRSAYFDLTGLSNTACLGHTAGGVVDVSNRVEIGNTSVTWIGGEVGWSTYSDQRIKENIKTDVPGLSFISQLRPVTYNLNIHRQNEMVHSGEKLESNWPEKYDIEKIKITGFIAQEVAQAAKDVEYDFSGVEIPKNPNDLYSLRYSDFVVPLVKAVQEMNATDIELKQTIASQQQIIETLITQLETLKTEVAAMRDKKNSEQ